MDYLNFDDLPEHIKEMLQQQAALAMRGQLQAHVARQDLREFLEIGKPEHILAVRRMVAAIETNPGAASFYDGMLAGFYAARTGACLFCSDSHEGVADGAEHLLHQTTGGPTPTEGPANMFFNKFVPRQVEELDVLDNDAIALSEQAQVPLDAIIRVLDFDFPTGGAEVTEEIRAAISAIAYKKPVLPLAPELVMKAAEWELDDAWEDPGNDHLSPENFLGWQCTACKRQIWPSIQDRMLSPKGIDGCPGCRLKSAHG